MKGRTRLYNCGVPAEACTGSLTTTSKSMGVGIRTHGSTEAAFNCQRRNLLKLGYTQIGSRDFAAPNGGPVRVLTKKSRYGGELRSGKEGTRSMPAIRYGGIIISC